MGTSVGLPRMHREADERRDFLPRLVAWLARSGGDEIVIERGYGAGLGLSEDAYLRTSDRARVTDHDECLEQDVVVVLRSPETAEFARMTPGSTLVSMLHYPTRPERVRALLRRGIRGISLDAIVDDRGRRLVQDFETVAWTGVREAFRDIRSRHPHFEHPGRRPLHVTCLGSGAVGAYAVHAATRYGDPSLREELVERNVPGVEVTVVDFDLTWHEDYMRSRLATTDLLIDATHRADPSRPAVPNAWLAELPADAVILDLAADPYELDASPPVTKGIEGVPHGDLDRWRFPVDDPAWDELDPRIDTTNRRTSLSCGSWPGLSPRDSMETYGAQLEPVLRFVLQRRGEPWDVDGDDPVERAVARSEVARWVQV